MPHTDACRARLRDLLKGKARVQNTEERNKDFEEREANKKSGNEQYEKQAMRPHWDEGIEEIHRIRMPNEPSSNRSSVNKTPTNPRKREGAFMYGKEMDVSAV